MKIFKKLILIFLAVLFLVVLFYVRPRHVVPILMYHAIGEKKGNTLHVSPRNFERQMRFLNKGGYSVVPLNSLVKSIVDGTRLPSKTVVITFDDGHKNNYLHAFPVLSKYDMPATIFLITNYVDKREDYLRWDQVNLMLKNGIDFGGHTRNHIYLPSVSSESQLLWDEIAGCKEDIEKNTGQKVRYFCYPTGGFDEKIKDVVKKAGYKGACTTNRGLSRVNRDVYELKRVKITNSDMNKPFHFRAKLSGYYNLFRRLKSGS